MSFSDEWFTSFCELYNLVSGSLSNFSHFFHSLFPFASTLHTCELLFSGSEREKREILKKVEISSNGAFQIEISRLSGYDVIEKPLFHRKKFCQWQIEENGELTRCSAQVNRPCSNAHCSKVACAERHSVTICLRCSR